MLLLGVTIKSGGAGTIVDMPAQNTSCVPRSVENRLRRRSPTIGSCLRNGDGMRSPTSQPHRVNSLSGIGSQLHNITGWRRGYWTGHLTRLRLRFLRSYRAMAKLTGGAIQWAVLP